MLTQKQKQETLRFIQSQKGDSFTFRDLVRFLDLESDHRRSLRHHLEELDAEGIIHRIKRGRYALPSRENLVSGVLSCHRDGYGFVAPDDRTLYKQDIFVAARNMEDAMHGDRIVIKVALKKRPPPRHAPRGRGARSDDRERLEGTVVRVLERKYSTIVGRYYEHSRFPFVAPLDARMLHDIQVPANAAKNARHGQIVVAALTTPPGKYQNPSGKIIEVLGYPDEPGIEYKIVYHKFGLPVEFSAQTTAEVDGIPDRVLAKDLARREDFRGEVSVTIDGESARDFDDAITLKKLDSGNFLLGVHIADVSHYVRENTSLDQDAYIRGTSVYFPDRAIPMLPHPLSSGICSLKPREDRLVFSVIMEVNPRGAVINSRFVEGVLHSRERMTYTSVARILVDRDPDEIKRYQDLISLFETMETLCGILIKARYRRGAIDFDLPEADIHFDERGKVIDILPSERNIAHRIIEEFMLLANETVAQKLTDSGGRAYIGSTKNRTPKKSTSSPSSRSRWDFGSMGRGDVTGRATFKTSAGNSKGNRKESFSPT